MSIEPHEPLECRGEDQEIDTKATQDAFYSGYDNNQESDGRSRKISEVVIEKIEAAAEKIGEGARRISDHYNQGWKEN